MTSRAAPIGLLLLLLTVSGCGGEASPLGWTIQFDRDSDRDETVIVVTRVLEGGCSGTESVYEGVINLRTGSSAAQPPEIESGTYGFYVEARNTTCQTVDSVCDEFDLPLEQTEIVSVLDGIDGGGGGCPPGTSCDTGNCIRDIPDGGTDVFIPCESEGASCDDGMGLTGTCHGGSCCLGCWDGTACQVGSTAAACGAAGAMCESCAVGDTCQGTTCAGPASDSKFAMSPKSVFYLHSNGSYWANGDDEMFNQLGPVAADGNHLRGYQGSETFVDIAAAEIATAALDADGNLYTWGLNGAGILGSGSTDFARVVTDPARVDSTNLYRQVTGGAGFFCAIHINGSLFCWGGGTSGQLATTATFRDTPTQVGDRKWIMVDAGFEHACGIRDDRALFCWGNTANGRLGEGTTSMGSQTSPARVGMANDWVQVSAGQGHTCGIRSTGGERHLYCWGRTTSGVLGIGDPRGATEFATPQQVGTGSLVEVGWQRVTAGEFHTCGLVDRGMGGVEAFCWGFTGFGAHGGGETSMTALSPVAVALPSNTGWTTITAGFQQSCGIANDVPYCWGDSRLDAAMEIDKTWLGIGATAETATPTEVVFSPALP